MESFWKESRVERLSERYWITGVQLGMLIAIQEECDRHVLIDTIIDKQFMNKVTKK